MSQHYVLRCVMDGVGFMWRVTKDVSIDMLRAEISRRHKIHSIDEFSLSYATPGCKECVLVDENDMKMLFFAANLYKVDVIEIKVENKTGVHPRGRYHSSNSLLSEDGAEPYLGKAYRTPATKVFMSDEWSSYIKGVGQISFGGNVEFRDKVKKYAVHVGFDFVYIRNDNEYILLQCVDHTCCFYIKGSMSSSSGWFSIDRCELGHNCKTIKRSLTHRLLDSALVSTCIKDDVTFEYAIRPPDIMAKFKLNYGFTITYKVAAKARYKAIEKVYGKKAETFNKLLWYRDAVLSSNPGSVIELEVNRRTNRFERIFVAYGGCIKGFNHCLPLLYVDGTFGSSCYKGQVLAATSRNGNQGMYPLAVCICDSETEDNWMFFLNNLKKITDQNPRVITFVSDRGKGLLNAFRKIFPNNPHLYCYKHLQDNLKLRLIGKGKSKLVNDVQDAFWKCAYSSSEIEYHHNLKVLRELGGANLIDDFLRDLPVERWCRAFDIGSRFGVMANGMAESFNKWIIIERLMPAYTLLEELRLKQMEMISERRTKCKTWYSVLTPVMEKRLQEQIDNGKAYRVTKSSDGVFEVRDEFSYHVKFADRTCSCKKWQINSFPCPHAAVAIESDREINRYDLIDPMFSVETYTKCYDYPIVPVTNVDEMYYECDEPHVQEPFIKIPPGRPRKKRFKSFAETLTKKKKIVCGRCKKAGHHNKKTCTAPIAP